MGVDENLYRLVLVLHILTAIVGFGGMLACGLYINEVPRLSGRTGKALVDATAVVGRIPMAAFCAAPVLGIMLVWLSDDLWKFDQAWISGSFLAYIALIIIALTVQVPTMRKLRAHAVSNRHSEATIVGSSDRLRVGTLQELKELSPTLHQAQRVLMELEGITLDKAYEAILEASDVTGQTELEIAEEVLATGQRPDLAVKETGRGVPSPELEGLVRRANLVGGIVNVIWAVVLCLMVFKPGV